MKVLLAAVNAKYIHSNLGIYSLRRYAKRCLEQEDADSFGIRIELGEYTINQTEESILRDIYRRRPDIVGFSCYIWNIVHVKALARDLKKVLPGTRIWLGGPEASFRAGELLFQYRELTGILRGEGEESFRLLARYYVKRTGSLEEIPGAVFRLSEGKEEEGAEIHENAFGKPLDLSMLPFPYQGLSDFEHRIIYYESSRGCPFSCSYCLSSVEKQVRFRDLKLVFEELQYFLDAGVTQVKFVDRTFNCSHSHALAVWSYLLEHDNGVTNFHFEIAADLLTEEELALMKRMRPGLIQLEIGVQSVNPQTIRAIQDRKSTRLNSSHR